MRFLPSTLRRRENLDAHAAFYRHRGGQSIVSLGLTPGHRAERGKDGGPGGRQRIDHSEVFHTGQLDQRGVVPGPAGGVAEALDSSTGTIGSSLPCTMTVRTFDGRLRIGSAAVYASGTRSGGPPSRSVTAPSSRSSSCARARSATGAKATTPPTASGATAAYHSARCPPAECPARIGRSTATGRSPGARSPWRAGRARRRRRTPRRRTCRASRRRAVPCGGTRSLRRHIPGRRGPRPAGRRVSGPTRCARTRRG